MQPEMRLFSSAFDAATTFLQEAGDEAHTPERNVLCEIFHAPGILIDIPRRLSSVFPAKAGSSSNSSASTTIATQNENDQGPMTPISVALSASTTLPLEISSIDTLLPTPNSRHDPFPGSGETFPDSATHHLVLACYIRMLRIYGRVITALQGDASELKNARLGSPPLNAEMRFGVLAQLIGQLLERLRKAITVYFFQLPNKTDTAAAAAAQDAALDISGMPEVDLGSVSGLESGVQDELKGLQDILQT